MVGSQEMRWESMGKFEVVDLVVGGRGQEKYMEKVGLINL